MFEKPVPAFRLRLIELPSNKSKSITLYQGKEQKTCEQVMACIINSLRREHDA